MSNNITKLNEPEWHIIDCSGRILGRVATEAADLLRGKRKINFVTYLDCGDHVVIINAKDIEVSGNKLKDKIYYHHTWHPGGLRAESLGDIMKEHPEKALINAVKGMLPDNKIKNEWMKRLHVYADAEHPHKANIAQKAAK